MVHVRAADFCRRSISRKLQLFVLFWAAVVSQFDITSKSRSELFVGLSPLVGRDAGEDEEGEVDESGLMLAICHSSSNRRQFIRHLANYILTISRPRTHWPQSQSSPRCR